MEFTLNLADVEATSTDEFDVAYYNTAEGSLDLEHVKAAREIMANNPFIEHITVTGNGWMGGEGKIQCAGVRVSPHFVNLRMVNDWTGTVWSFDVTEQVAAALQTMGA